MNEKNPRTYLKDASHGALQLKERLLALSVFAEQLTNLPKHSQMIFQSIKSLCEHHEGCGAL